MISFSILSLTFNFTLQSNGIDLVYAMDFLQQSYFNNSLKLVMTDYKRNRKQAKLQNHFSDFPNIKQRIILEAFLL